MYKRRDFNYLVIMWSSTEYLCVIALAIAIICITQFIFKRKNPKCNVVLPPGSMGLPIIGESLELIIPSYSLDVPRFIKKRLQRYGPIFRTNLVGRAIVVSADPEFNHFIFMQEGKLVESWYLDLFAKVFRQGDEKADGGAFHKYARKTALKHFGMESLKGSLFSQIQEMVHKTLSTWSTQNCIEVKRATSVMAFNFSAKRIFSFDAENSPMNFTDKFINFSQGLMSFPLNIPGTAYNKCLKDYKETSAMFANIVRERRASPDKPQNDMLDCVIQDMNVEECLTENVVVGVIFGLLFANLDSISSMLTLMFKLLSENPSVSEELIAENEAIRRTKENPDSPITWEEYKSMTFTLQVVHETLRLGSVAPGFFRRAKQDIHVNGYTIPAGWVIMVAASAIHLSPNTFEDPLAFNPWRWKELQANVKSKNFMPFGSGSRQCAGAEFSRGLLVIFLHVLVTKYRWTKVGGGNVVRNPMLCFKDGVHIKVSKKHA